MTTPPTLHPRLLRQPPRWEPSGLGQLPEALAPGLAAQLAPLTMRLPVQPGLADNQSGVLWRCAVQIPSPSEPQHPAPWRAARRLLVRDLPWLLQQMTGQPWTPRQTFIEAWALRKGSGFIWQTGEHELDALLGLSVAQWPDAWGGRCNDVALGYDR
ncbi:MAG: hypothetical protein AAFV53_28755, partial [Myxococcota bacterium]